MIAYLQGTIRQRHPARVILDVHGVGYALSVPVSTYAQLPSAGAAAGLHVYTHVREDAIQLFGFATSQEQALFEKLIGVNGVGPKLALAILSGLHSEALTSAIRHSDYARLTAIPGVGRKTAERVVIELRDKLEGMPAEEQAPAVASGAAIDVVSALVNLGYAQPLAEKTVSRVSAQMTDADFDLLFMQCMKSLGG